MPGNGVGARVLGIDKTLASDIDWDLPQYRTNEAGNVTPLRILGVLEPSEDEAVVNGVEGIDKKANISRNAPCPCGSGKRYKHCHGKY